MKLRKNRERPNMRSSERILRGFKKDRYKLGIYWLKQRMSKVNLDF